MNAGKINATLEKQVRFNGVVMNRREMIDRMIARGDKVFTREENKIKPMTRAAFNRASGAEQAAHERKVREGGKVTIYCIGDPNDSWHEVGKIEFDYALSKTRQENPVPASRLAGNKRADLDAAADLFRRFTGHEPHQKARHVKEDRGAFLRVGTVDGILYTTNRNQAGKAEVEQYIHHFNPASRPELLVSGDGKVARTHGGKFTFTERGFVDEDATGEPIE